MTTLSKIETSSNWGSEATKINQNFTNVNTELTKLNNTYGLKIPLFASESEAYEQIPNPYYGQIVLIGTELPAEIHKWNGSRFAPTGIMGGSASTSLTDYYTKEEVNTFNKAFDERIEKIEERDIFLTEEEYISIVPNENNLYYIYE